MESAVLPPAAQRSSFRPASQPAKPMQSHNAASHVHCQVSTETRRRAEKSATIAGRLAPTTVTATAEQSRSALSFQTCYGEAQSGRYKLWGGDCRQDQQAGHAARAKSVRRQSGGESSEQGARTGRLPLQSGVSWFLKINIQRCGAESCGSVIRNLQMGPMRIRLIL